MKIKFLKLQHLFLAILFLFVIPFSAAGSSFAGLPATFEPSVGYFHSLNNNVVSLWDKNGNNYISVDGGEFKLLSKESLTSQGIPPNFIPVVGYYHPHNGGRVSLFDANGVLYARGS
ncbi:MAG: hypothetical protein QXH60_02310, partial [Candidatus Pacearchaeota archaeon]